MSELRFAAFGAGFWARFQLAGWREIGGTTCVAIYNRTRSKAEALAREFDISAVYDDPEELLRNENLDFVDILTDVDSHARFVHLAAAHKLPAICQKPLAPSLEIAEEMVRTCAQAGVPLYVNENWRWQTPIREVSRILASGEIGKPFRARLDMISGFPVYANQPFLKQLKQFILTDMGSHILDVARFLFGEARTLYCQTARVHADIQGEDVATVMMDMDSGVTVLVELAYAENFLERDKFPETCIFVEAERGSLELTHDFGIRVTTKNGTLVRKVPPPRFPWADPAYDIVHSSIVPCQANLLRALRGEVQGETRANDNLKTVRLVSAAYESAEKGQTIRLR
jgi:predicted dehydrogenase